MELKKLFCPKCVELGLKSRIRDYGGMTTLIGTDNYYDEEGDYHCHNPNVVTSKYSCSNNHQFSTKTMAHCINPSCDYNMDVELVVTIHDDVPESDKLKFNINYHRAEPNIMVKTFGQILDEALSEKLVGKTFTIEDHEGNFSDPITIDKILLSYKDKGIIVNWKGEKGGGLILGPHKLHPTTEKDQS